MTRGRVLTIKRLLFLGLPLCLLLSVMLLGSWLLFSESGARWLWGQFEGATGNSLSAARVEGSMVSGLSISGLEYKTPELNVSARAVLVQARPAFWPFSIEVQRLFLQGVTVHHLPLNDGGQSTDTPMDIGASIDALVLPMPLSVKQVKIEQLEYWQAGPEPLMSIDVLSFSLAMDENLEINNLLLGSQYLAFQGNAQLALSSPYLLNVSSSGQFTAPESQVMRLPVLPFALQVNGDLEKLGFSLTSEVLELEVSGELVELPGKPVWDINGLVGKLPQAMQFAGDEIVVSGLEINSAGNLDDWKVVLDSSLAINDLEPVKLSVSARGSMTGVNVQQATLKGSGVELEVNGEIDWSNDLQANLHAMIDRLDVSPWVQEWPEGSYLRGKFDINWSEEGLRIPTGNLTVSETGFAANFNADIDLQTTLVDAHLDWTNFYWPLQDQVQDKAPMYESAAGWLDIRGSMDRWATNGELELQVGDYPAGRFKIEGEGNRESAHTRLLQGDVLGGQLRGAIELDWTTELQWALDLSAEGVDPEPLFPGWPGQLDASFQVASDGPSMPVIVQLDSLQGMLRGTLIDASGKFGIANDHAWFENVVVRTDHASLQLDGNSSEEAGVTAEFSGQLPSMILQGASGSVEMKARFSSNRSAPLIGMQMQAIDFAWNGLGIKSMEISTSQEPTTKWISTFDLGATGVRWKNEVIDEVSVSLRGRDQDFHLQASLASELVDLNTAVEMTPADVDDLLHGRWSGLLTSLDLIIAQKLNFALAGPASMTWSDGAFSLQAACLNEAGGAGVCAGLEHDAEGQLAITADVTAFPIDYLRHLYELDVKFEQTLDGRLEWNQSSNQKLTGGADFRITAGQVVDLVDNEALLDSNAGKLKFNLRDGNLESGILDIEFPGVGFIDVEFEVTDITDENGRQLTGRAVSQLNNIELIGQLAFPGVAEVNGQFNSNIRLGGTLLDPEFDGGFSLTKGLLHYQPTGLKLEDVQLTGKVDSRDRGSLKGQFRAGEGIGVIEGRFQFENPQNMNLELNLSGEQLLLINTQTIKVLSDTKLDIGLSPNRLDINGRILVPSAHLTPEKLVLETVSDSEDLVIETRGAETAENEKNKTSGTRVFGTLEVAFGDDVKVKVPDINTSVHGSVEYRWNGDVVPVAEGSYLINGTVDIYGPTLNINNGSISFPGVPANNPLLNIRAQRDIFGNTQIRSAGVQVIGTLKRPVLEAFTVPVTNEDRAWALLVTGSDFDQSQGVGGFDVGTYIGPKLYVSYGISLFENENVVSARYDLKKGFGIKVTSGQRETGLDISYTIDR